MFKVKKKGTDEISTVYDVSGTRFLVYIEGQDPRWEWHDMNDYEPETLELFNQPVTLGKDESSDHLRYGGNR